MTGPGSLTEAATTGVFWSAVASIGHRLATTVVFVVLARLLDPAAFGLVALAAVVVALMSTVIDQGFGQALVQRLDPEPEHFNTVFWISLGTAFVLAATVVAGSGPIAELFGEPELATVLRWLALSPLIASASAVPNAILRRELAFRTMAARRLFSVTVGGVAGVTAAALGFGVWSLVTQTLVTVAVGTVVVWTICPWRPGVALSRRHFSDVFGFSSNVLGVNLLNFVNRRADDLLIGAVLGPVALGIYSVAYRVLFVMTQVLTHTVSTVAFPVFSKMQADVARVRRAFLKATQLSASIAIPMFAFVAVLAPEIVATLFGPKWKDSVPILQVLCGIGALHSIAFFNYTVLMALGKANWALRLTAMNAVFNLAGFIIAVRWGILAVAIAYVTRGYLTAPIPVLAIRRLTGLDIGAYVAQLAAPVASTAVMAGAVLLGRDWLGGLMGDLPLLALLTVLGGAIYVASLRMMDARLAGELWTYARRGLPSARATRRDVPVLAGEAGPAR